MSRIFGGPFALGPWGVECRGFEVGPIWALGLLWGEGVWGLDEGFLGPLEAQVNSCYGPRPFMPERS